MFYSKRSYKNNKTGMSGTRLTTSNVWFLLIRFSINICGVSVTVSHASCVVEVTYRCVQGEHDFTCTEPNFLYSAVLYIMEILGIMEFACYEKLTSLKIVHLF